GTGTASNIVAVSGSTGVNPYAAATYASLDLAGTWFIIDGQTRPILRSEYSTNIVNAHQLQLMALNLAANYTLGADIDASETSRAAGVWNLANGFSPIGPAFPSASFTGSLDGQGHTVSNLTIIDATPALQTSSVVDANGYVGLFGVIGAGATVQNINLANARITGGDGMAVGALAGIVRGTVNNASSSGLVADGNSLADNDLNRPASAQFAVALAGGLVGDAEFSGSITNSSSSATVTAGNGAAAGGLAGALLYGASASSVSATGNVAVGAGTTFVASSAGGLAGSIDGFPAGEVNPIQVTVTGSHAAGNVSGGPGSFDAGFAGEVQQGEVANSFATGNASGGGGSLVGGFAADVYQGQVSNSYATGNVAALTPPPAGPGTGSGGSTPAGGGGSVFESIVGGFAAVVDNGGLVTGSYSSGAVTTAAPVSANSITLAGGFVGYVNVSGSVSESYSLGSVATTGPEAPAGDVAVTGGFAGDVAGSFGNVYATGATLSATSPVTDFTGGLIGFLSGAVTTGYWDEGTTGQVSAIGLSSGTATNLIGVGGATGLNPYAAATYANFDLANTWFIIDGETRPILRAEYSTDITDAHQLELMSLNLSGFYTLGGNIDASETSSATGVWNPANGFVPVGALATTPFNGILLGSGDTIANLTIIDTTPVAQTLPSGIVSNGAVGLFGFDAGSVDEINLANVSVTAGPGMSAGAYAGSLTGPLSFVSVSSGAVTTGGGSPSGLPEAGGLVGDFGDLNGNGLIINSSSAATVTGGTNANVGGLVGIAHATITDSNASGDVTVGSVGAGGGLVGEAEGSQAHTVGISASFATGTVTGAADTPIGGFAGVIFNATLSQDYATGTVAQAAGGPNGGQANEAGGFVGVFDAGSISQSFASGAVSTVAGGAGAGAGGFVGDDSGTITDSYATGAVTMSGGGQSLGAGGFAGTIEAAGSLVRVLATGPVSGPGPAGGVAGAVTNGGQIAGSYWDEGTTGQTNAAGQGAGVGATGIGGATGISPFADATYAGFDFINTWSAPSAGFYPELFGVSHVLRVTGGDTTSVYGSFPILTDSIFGQQANPTGFGMSGLTWTLLGLTTSTSGFFNVGAYGLALSGANASDFSGAYRVVYVNGQLTVTPKPLAGLLTGVVQKTYDGTTNATLSAGDFNGLSGVIAGDIVSLNASVTGTYATQNVGSGIVVTATGVSLTGADAQDYTIGGSVSGPVGVITPATLTASLSGTVEKTYDGTTAATLTPGDYALSGAVAGDDVGLNDPTAGAYATQNVGAGIVVTATGLSLTGTTAQDYTVNNSVSAPVGVIDPKTLAVALTGTVEKTYDGTTAATLAPGDFTLLGVVDGDDVGVSGSSSGTYATQNAGTGIVVTATGVSLTGTAAQNYTIGAGPNGLDPNGLDSNGGGQNGIGVSGPVGVIDPKTLTVSLTGTVEKTFDGTTTATLSPNNYVLSGGVIGSDAVSLNDPTTGTYDSSAVGVGKPVTVDNLTLTGSNASDYHVNMTAVGNIGVIDAAAAASIIQVQVVTSPPDGALTEDLVVPLTPPATTGQGSGPGAADVFVAPFTVFPVVQDQSAAAFGQALPITGAGNGDLWVGSDLDEKDKR
ncbi:MAG TPA: YDG domain-containing protein, partial [Caulobacteraceae bacterium]|nr:YDG domain-containing protein [Caulobacteraceae bacterium]